MAQINKPNEYFNTITWSGDSSSPKTFTVGFQPDLIWGKLRNTAYNHQLYDSVRGFGNNKDLQSSATTAEGGGTADLYGYISGTTSTGFTATKGSDATADGYGYWNESGRTYVAWNWLGANGTASNTDGSITSTVSANTTSGFSIVKYTGTGSNATVGHGLGSAPKFIILKTIDAARDWNVYHGGISNMASGYIILNATDAFSTAFSTIWNNTDPTSSVFSVGTANTSNNLNSNYIAYCFAEKKGFSKFGSYTGNGNADGTFVYTGFKPAFVIQKRTDALDIWRMFDNKREGYNVDNNAVAPNSSGAEGTGDFIDLLSNGFKFRSTDDDVNGSGGSYIYIAFAEEPLVGDNPATAR